MFRFIELNLAVLKIITLNMMLDFFGTLYICFFFFNLRKCQPWRLVEGNCANVQLLYLIDGPDGQGAVVGQSQTVEAKIIPEHH